MSWEVMEDYIRNYDEHQAKTPVWKVEGSEAACYLNHRRIYAIPLADLKKFNELVRWVDHIAEKTWMTKEGLVRLLRLAQEVRGQ